jgi:hypothetical protein
VGGNAVALVANANGKFVSATNAGKGALVASAAEPAAWEVFYRSVV